jgi:hypothetical protein
MKRSELKEIIKSAMSAETPIEETLVDADQDMAEAILNALGGEAAFEAVVRAMSTDDAQVYLGGIMRDHDIEMGREDEMDNTPITITRDIMDNLGLEEAKKDDEEEEEVEDVEVDAEEDITLDEPEEEEMDMEPESDTSGLDAGEKDLQNNLEKALEAAKEMGDEKLAKQIGNTITFFTRTHVVGDAGSVEEVEVEEVELNEGYTRMQKLAGLTK